MASFHNIEKIEHLEVNPEGISFLNMETHTNYQKLSLYGFEKLLPIDELNLYTTPMNNDSRGGKRLLFSSKQLAIHLYNELFDVYHRQAYHPCPEYPRRRGEYYEFDLEENRFCFPAKLPNDGEVDYGYGPIPFNPFLPSLFENMVAVNHVFRYNTFNPDDLEFKPHYDTPYVNHDLNLISKYTVLIYLTAGENANGTLIIGDTVINQINAGDVYIFDQRLFHSAKPFENGNKIFLRTELIYEGLNAYDTSPVAAALFNSSCYLAKESIANPDLKPLVTQLFNDTMRFRLGEHIEVVPPVFTKELNGLSFETNGNTYKFDLHADIKACVIVILLDYFGGEQCSITDLFQNNYTVYNGKCDCYFCKDMYDTANFTEEQKQEGLRQATDLSNKIPIENICQFNQNLVASQLDTIMIMGNKMVINDTCITIERNRVRFNNRLDGAYHFASCQMGIEDCTVDKEYSSSHAAGFTLPPISYQITDCLEFTIDAFNNGFMYQTPVVINSVIDKYTDTNIILK